MLANFFIWPSKNTFLLRSWDKKNLHEKNLKYIDVGIDIDTDIITIIIAIATYRDNDRQGWRKDSKHRLDEHADKKEIEQEPFFSILSAFPLTSFWEKNEKNQTLVFYRSVVKNTEQPSTNNLYLNFSLKAKGYHLKHFKVWWHW